MQKKTINRYIALSVMLMLSACSIPAINTKTASTTLPEQFDAQQLVNSESNVAQTDWRSFFDDPELVKLIDEALQNNKELNIMTQRIAMADNEVLARSGENEPFVNFGAGVDIGKEGEYTRKGAVEENLDIKEGKSFPRFLQNYQVGLNASWEIDIWKKLRNATTVARLEYLSSVEGKRFLTTNLVAEIANSYYELQSLDTQLDNINQNLAVQKNGLSVVQTLQQYARATSLAVKRFEAEVKKNESRKYVVMQQIVEAENHLNLLLGRTPKPIDRNSDRFWAVDTNLKDVGIPSQLLANRPDIRRADMALQAAKLNIQVAKANFYPSFAMRAKLGFEAFNPKYLLNTPESLLISLGGELVAPLINRKAITAHYKNASAEQIEAAYEYEQSIINAYVEVANQITNIDNLSHNYDLKVVQVDTLTDSIEVANQLFKSAHADYLEVLLTQREALEAKHELIETKQQQISAKINLYRALGGGWDQTEMNANTTPAS